MEVIGEKRVLLALRLQRVMLHDRLNGRATGPDQTSGGARPHRRHHRALGLPRMPQLADERDGISFRDAHDLGVHGPADRAHVDHVVGDDGRDDAPVRDGDDLHLCAHVGQWS